MFKADHALKFTYTHACIICAMARFWWIYYEKFVSQNSGFSQKPTSSKEIHVSVQRLQTFYNVVFYKKF